MPVIQNSMQWEPVVIPISKGVDLTTRDRLIEAGTLAKAENVYYPKTGGPVKRRGHIAVTPYNAFMDYVGDAPKYNLYGYGLFDPDNIPSGDCVYGQAGNIRDIITYEDRELVWDGWRLFEIIDSSGKSKVVTATMPVLKTAPEAKTANSQYYACSADNGTIRVVAFVENWTTSPVAYVKVYNSTTGTLKFTATLNTGSGDVKFVRTVSVGSFCYVLVSDISDEVVYCYGIHNVDTDVRTPIQLTNDTSGVFDVWKFDETKFLVGNIDGGVVKLTWVNYDGTINESNFSQNTVASLSGGAINLALCVHPISEEIAIIINTGTNQYYRRFDKFGVALGSEITIGTAIGAQRLAIAPTYVDNKFHVYYDKYDTAWSIVKRVYHDSTQETEVVRYNAILASRATRVGNLQFVWTSTVNLSVQTTYFLMDSDLLPVARCEYGTAVQPSTIWLPSINYVVSSDGVWNTTKFNGAILYRQRIDFEAVGDGTVFSEESIKTYTLNFLPDKLSYAVAGKTLYIAGGQLWSYDGDKLLEAEFGTGIEAPSVVTSNGAGSLTPSATYYWRVDVVRKNAQNEEIRVISYATDQITMGAADDTATITWPHILTRATDCYYLVFRIENGGTNFYLVSSRDPQSAPKYSTASATVSFTDTMSDASMLDKEQHPANAFNYIDQIAAPACELVTFGQNRLWISGGELSPGEVWPSRLFYSNQTPTFNWRLGLNVDTDSEDITGLVFQSDYGIVFKKSSTYIVTGNVTPNVYQAIQPNVQLALSDRGCVNHKSIARLFNSIVFQSENGFKAVNAAGAMEDIGIPVETIKGTVICSAVVKEDEHLRIYQSDQPSLVLDYRDKLWTTFVFGTNPNAGAYSIRRGRMILAVGNRLFYETDGVYTDDGYSYNYLIKTAPLAAQIGGFQRVRRVYCIGEKSGTPPPVTIRLYLNGNSWWSEQYRWDYSDDLNTSTMGASTLGSGYLGDTESVPFRDDLWKWRKRVASSNQRCENIAIELTDKGRINSNQWIPVAFALEIGTKSGLDRIGAKTMVKE